MDTGKKLLAVVLIGKFPFAGMITFLLAFGPHRFIVTGLRHEVAVVIACLHDDVGIFVASAVFRIVFGTCVG